MNMTIKELQTTCDDLHWRFVCRLSHVTDFETFDEGDRNEICLYIDKNHDDHITITKWNDGDIWFWADDFNGLLYGTAVDHDLIQLKLSRLINSKRDFKKFISEVSDKPLDQKKRAILLELKTKIETLLKDYL